MPTKQRDETAGLILLVEDNRGIAEMVGEFLERRGYSLDYASDGVTGLRLTGLRVIGLCVIGLRFARLSLISHLNSPAYDGSCEAAGHAEVAWGTDWRQDGAGV